MPQYNDYPLTECARDADKIIAKGGEVFQKFTCEKCGSRQTVDTPNVFYTSGRCEECQHVTDLTLKGCNYLVIYA
jgi:hypothetical protein